MAISVVATWLIFFIVSIAASRLGTIFPKIGLPLITGYLVVGAVAGPFVLGVIQKDDLPRLGYVTQFALAFIAFSAGSELYLPELRSLFKRILYQTTSIAIFSFCVCCLVIYGIGSAGVVPWMAELESGCRLSVSAIAASIMVARSPASAIAVVKEMKAKVRPSGCDPVRAVRQWCARAVTLYIRGVSVGAAPRKCAEK
jgi:Kef-type K+ transport system membrane component KefB